MGKEYILVLTVVCITYYMDPTEDLSYFKPAIGAAVLFSCLGFYWNHKIKRAAKVIFKQTESLVKLIKDKDIDVFKERCLSLTPEFIQKMKMYSNYTLLIACACFQGYEEAKFLLQEMKVDINEQAKNGETALIRAVHFNDYEMVELLLKAGANTELRTKQSISAFITAITREKPLLVDLLLKYGTEIDMKIQKSTIQTVLDNCSEKIKSIIEFHKGKPPLTSLAWRRKKNILVILNKTETDKAKNLQGDLLKVLNRKNDLFKSIVRDYM
ncbi:unnamed protein product [Moneuplotes crassus]|uniref:Ankyrin repeat domain-containing protein n=1 Tax=Euplotes crassus TaxID=5936 RepID=A0AAD1XML8_EUPCR|nr:unnamed protein product [Moneuplotes crassus]